MEIELTEVGRNWLQKHHPQGIPYHIPSEADSKPTIKKVAP